MTEHLDSPSTPRPAAAGALALALGLAGCAVDIGADAPVGATDRTGQHRDAGRIDARSATAPGASIFALDRVHTIEITVDPEYLDSLENDREHRVPCTFRFDGIELERVGIRQKGGLGSVSDLSGKPGFSLKLDDGVRGQKLDGLDKLTLNNAIQDPTLLHEHLGYELYRGLGIPASRTSHAIVSLNGFAYGIYVVAESVEKDFLRRQFDGLGDGNLYEAPCCGDFVWDPDFLELKDPEGRSRDDLYTLAAAIRDSEPDAFVDRVGALVDLDNFITGYAIDALVDHWDGYAFSTNNYYLYHRPSDDRFVFLPHGMDQLFQDYQRDPLAEPGGTLAQRVRAIPALDDRFHAALNTILFEHWDVDALHARMDQVSEILHATDRSEERFLSDLQAFDDNLATEKQKIADRKSELADGF
jgi:spore coat protein H